VLVGGVGVGVVVTVITGCDWLSVWVLSVVGVPFTSLGIGLASFYVWDYCCCGVLFVC